MRLRLGDAVEVQVARRVAKVIFGIEASRQMQRSEDRHRTLGRMTKEAAALVVDEVKFVRMHAQVIEDCARLLLLANIELIRGAGGWSCCNESSRNARAFGSRDGCTV